MLLNQTAQYALRAMAWIATLDDDEAIPAKDLAEATDIPLHYLQKVLRRLVIEGVLKSRKGRGGGFSLARPRKEVTFDQVLHAVDAMPEKGVCAWGWGQCDATHPCPLHQAWSPLTKGFQQWARTTTLEDVQRIPPSVVALRSQD